MRYRPVLCKYWCFIIAYALACSVRDQCWPHSDRWLCGCGSRAVKPHWAIMLMWSALKVVLGTWAPWQCNVHEKKWLLTFSSLKCWGIFYEIVFFAWLWFQPWRNCQLICVSVLCTVCMRCAASFCGGLYYQPAFVWLSVPPVWWEQLSRTALYAAFIIWWSRYQRWRSCRVSFSSEVKGHVCHLTSRPVMDVAVACCHCQFAFS